MTLVDGDFQKEPRSFRTDSRRTPASLKAGTRRKGGHGSVIGVTRGCTTRHLWHSMYVNLHIIYIAIGSSFRILLLGGEEKPVAPNEGR